MHFILVLSSGQGDTNGAEAEGKAETIGSASECPYKFPEVRSCSFISDRVPAHTSLTLSHESMTRICQQNNSDIP